METVVLRVRWTNLTDCRIAELWDGDELLDTLITPLACDGVAITQTRIDGEWVSSLKRD